MAGGSAGVYLLPPRARARDWPLAGLCAGLILALAEQLVAVASGVRLPPTLAFLLALGNVALVATPCALVGLVVGALRARPSHSSVVVGVVGPLLYAAIAVPLLLQGEAQGRALALLLAAVIGGLAVLAARLADRAERAGVAASGPFVWGATALLLAGSARLAADTARPATIGSLVLAALLVVVGTVLAHEVIKRRGGSGRMRFGPQLLLLAGATGILSTLPLWLPWLVFDGAVRAPHRTSASLLIVALPTTDSQPTVDLLALEGGERPGLAPEALLGTPGGWIGTALSRSGYATAAIVRDPRLARARGAAELDAQPGGRALLLGPAGWTVAAPLLLGPAAPLLRLAGQDVLLRSADAIADDARRWLVGWRNLRAESPFFLFVDLRGGPAGDVDRALETLLHHLELLGAASSTHVAVVAGGAGGRLVVRAGEAGLPAVLAGTPLDVSMPAQSLRPAPGEPPS